MFGSDKGLFAPSHDQSGSFPSLSRGEDPGYWFKSRGTVYPQARTTSAIYEQESCVLCGTAQVQALTPVPSRDRSVTLEGR